MRWLGEKPFHTLLLLTEKPAEWASWKLALIPLALAAVTGAVWGRVTDDAVLAWAAGWSLFLFSLADWALLTLLPLRGVSFGPVQPPWLGLTLLRWLVSIAAALLALYYPLPAILGLVLMQALILLLLVYGTIVEPFRVQVTRVDTSSDRLAGVGQPVRIVHISDLHVERLTRRERALSAVVDELGPDLIVLTGDFLSTSYNDDPRSFADLEEVLGQLSAPGGIYAVWGTAEVDLPDLLRPLLEKLGIIVLEDRAVALKIHGHSLWLMGLTCSRDLAGDGARLHGLLEESLPGAASILLYHTPDLMPQAASLGVDLYLAGHTHGGQWRVPGFGALLTSSHYWKRYEAGAYRDDSTLLYVSRGLGMEGFGALRARFFCPPELVQIALSGAKERYVTEE